MKKTVFIFLTIAVLILCFLGLAGRSLSQEPKIEKHNGVTIISNPKTPRPENDVPIRVVFTEELSIGAEYGDEEYMFGNRVYFNVDVDGNVYVNDWDKKCIRKFSSDGLYLLTIGGPGQGPGEFRNVWQPRFDKNGNLYVSDISTNRITLFGKDGAFLEIVKIPNSLSNISINSRGFYLGYSSSMVEDRDGATVTFVIGLFDKKFQLLRELHKGTRQLKNPTGRGEDSHAQFLADLIGDDAFEPTPAFFLNEDDTIYFGFPEAYEIKVFLPDGELQKVIRRAYDPIKVGEKHIQGFIRYQEDEFFRFSRYPEEIKKKAFELIDYPQFKPAYDKFALMENGWIAVIVDHIADEYTLIDLFDREGKYIAQFEAEIPIDNLLFENGKAYALAIENDYRYVKRYAYEIQEKRGGKWISIR